MMELSLSALIALLQQFVFPDDVRGRQPHQVWSDAAVRQAGDSTFIFCCLIYSNKSIRIQSPYEYHSRSFWIIFVCILHFYSLQEFFHKLLYALFFAIFLCNFYYSFISRLSHFERKSVQEIHFILIRIHDFLTLDKLLLRFFYINIAFIFVQML